MEQRIESTTVRLIEADILTQPIDVLVRSAAPELGLAVGEVAVADAGDLPARWVIDAAGPGWRGGVHSEYVLMEQVHTRALLEAAERQARRISFAPVGTEAPRDFPRDRAPYVVLSTISRFIYEHPGALDEVLLVVKDAEHFQLYKQIFEEVAATMVHT